MVTINFGRICGLVVRSGRPDFSHRFRTIQTVKLAGGENGPRPEAVSVDFELRKEQVALLDQLAQLSDGTCVTVEVKHGLPFIVEIEQDHQAA